MDASLVVGNSGTPTWRMQMNAQVQIIEHDGQPEYAVVPIDTYRGLLALAEDMEDIRAL